MNTFIINECELGYAHYYFELNTNAEKLNIEKYNVLEARNKWVLASEIVKNLWNDGFDCELHKIEPSKSYLEYLKSDNFIQLKYGNY
jgi:predicted transcriptional regulator YdeE